jgi:hypothetical protein
MRITTVERARNPGSPLVSAHTNKLDIAKQLASVTGGLEFGLSSNQLKGKGMPMTLSTRT